MNCNPLQSHDLLLTIDYDKINVKNVLQMNFLLVVNRVGNTVFDFVVY